MFSINQFRIVNKNFILKKLFFIPFLIINSLVSAKTFYVSPAGNDGNSGSLSAPWKSLNFAFNQLTSGDTLYVRGGTYYNWGYRPAYASSIYVNDIDGTGNNPVCVLNYPGEKPVLDAYTSDNSVSEGLTLVNCSGWIIQGLTIMRVLQATDGSNTGVGFNLRNCSNILVKDCSAFSCMGPGFQDWNGNGFINYVNCDSYNNFDKYTVQPNGEGGNADGFVSYENGTSSVISYKGCRAWHNSDDGFDGYGTQGIITYDACWSFFNGYGKNGNGDGFKLGAVRQSSRTSYDRVLRNCVAFGNLNFGIDRNDAICKIKLYNNTIYKNNGGIVMGLYSDDDTVICRNNISDDYYFEKMAVQDHNSWNGGLIFSDDDFASLDTAGITGLRTIEGSLPELNFLKLKEGSDLIDAGVFVELPFNGNAPDLGAFEYSIVKPVTKYVKNITITGYAGASSISTNKGTLQLMATILPDDATNKSVFWSISEGKELATVSSNGLVTAIGNGNVLVRASATDGSGVFGTYAIMITNQTVPVKAIYISGDGGKSTISSPGGSLQLFVTIIPENATSKNVSWSLINGSGKATISSSGLVTASANGTVTARATATDGSGAYGSLIITISNQLSTTGNLPPVIVMNYNSSGYSGFVYDIDASDSFDPDKDNLSFSWAVPANISVSSTKSSTISFLGPNVDSPQSFVFNVNVSDGKVTESKSVSVEIVPYKPQLEEAEISKIEASSYKDPYYPYYVADGDIGTMWADEGDNQWLLISLKQPFNIQLIKIAFNPGLKRESYFDILGSEDLVKWEPILIKTTSCSFSGDIQVFEFPPAKTGKEYNFIKVIGHCNSLDNWNFISELKIFGNRIKHSPEFEALPFKVYPNPAKDFFIIRRDMSSVVPDFIQIIDLSGKVVFRQNIDPDVYEVLIPIDLQNNLYVMQLCSANSILFTQKLVVSR